MHQYNKIWYIILSYIIVWYNVINAKFICTSIFSLQSCGGLYHFIFRFLNFETNHFFYWGKLPMGDIRVESSINKHIPIIKHFSMFSSFLNQMEWCWCHWMCKSEGYKCSLSIESKGPKQETQEEDEWKFASSFLKVNSRPFSSSSPISSSSFLVQFEWFKTYGCTTRALQNSFVCVQ